MLIYENVHIGESIVIPNFIIMDRKNPIPSGNTVYEVKFIKQNSTMIIVELNLPGKKPFNYIHTKDIDQGELEDALVNSQRIIGNVNTQTFKRKPITHD